MERADTQENQKAAVNFRLKECHNDSVELGPDKIQELLDNDKHDDLCGGSQSNASEISFYQDEEVPPEVAEDCQENCIRDDSIASLDDVSDMNEEKNEDYILEQNRGEVSKRVSQRPYLENQNSIDERQDEDDDQIDQRPRFDTAKIIQMSQSSNNESDSDNSSTCPDSKDRKLRQSQEDQEFLAKLYKALPKAVDLRKSSEIGVEDDMNTSQFKRFESQMKAQEENTERKQQESIHKAAMLKKQKKRLRKKAKDGDCSFDGSAQNDSSDVDDLTDSSEDNDQGQDEEDAVDKLRDVYLKYDGWKFYRRLKVAVVPVKRYCNLLDEDYKRNKVTVCAHLSHIFNSFVVRRGKPVPNGQPNFFDIERWTAYQVFQKKVKHEKKKQRKQQKQFQNLQSGRSQILNNRDAMRATSNTFALTFDNHNFTQQSQPNLNTANALPNTQCLLKKTVSTEHIPSHQKSKETKRVYANYDKEIANRMFGYRVKFKEEKRTFPESDPFKPQMQKPLSTFVQIVVSELSSCYEPNMKFSTKQRILKNQKDENPSQTASNYCESGRVSLNQGLSSALDYEIAPSQLQKQKNQGINLPALNIDKTRTHDQSTDSPKRVFVSSLSHVTQSQLSPNRQDGTVTKYKVRHLPFVYETASSPRAESSPGPPRIRKFNDPQNRKKNTRLVATKSSPTHVTNPYSKHNELVRKLSGMYGGPQDKAKESSGIQNCIIHPRDHQIINPRVGAGSSLNRSIIKQRQNLSPEKRQELQELKTQALRNPYLHYQVRWEDQTGQSGFANALIKAKQKYGSPKKALAAPFQPSQGQQNNQSGVFKSSAKRVEPDNFYAQQSNCSLLHLGSTTRQRTNLKESVVNNIVRRTASMPSDVIAEVNLDKQTEAKNRIENEKLAVTPHDIAAAINQQKQKERMKRLADQKEVKRLTQNKFQLNNRRASDMQVNNAILVETNNLREYNNSCDPIMEQPSFVRRLHSYGTEEVESKFTTATQDPNARTFDGPYEEKNFISNHENSRTHNHSSYSRTKVADLQGNAYIDSQSEDQINQVYQIPPEVEKAKNLNREILRASLQKKEQKSPIVLDQRIGLAQKNIQFPLAIEYGVPLPSVNQNSQTKFKKGDPIFLQQPNGAISNKSQNTTADMMKLLQQTTKQQQQIAAAMIHSQNSGQGFIPHVGLPFPVPQNPVLAAGDKLLSTQGTMNKAITSITQAKKQQDLINKQAVKKFTMQNAPRVTRNQNGDTITHHKFTQGQKNLMQMQKTTAKKNQQLFVLKDRDEVPSFNDQIQGKSSNIEDTPLMHMRMGQKSFSDQTATMTSIDSFSTQHRSNLVSHSTNATGKVFSHKIPISQTAKTSIQGGSVKLQSNLNSSIQQSEGGKRNKDGLNISIRQQFLDSKTTGQVPPSKVNQTVNLRNSQKSPLPSNMLSTKQKAQASDQLFGQYIAAGFGSLTSKAAHASQINYNLNDGNRWQHNTPNARPNQVKRPLDHNPFGGQNGQRIAYESGAGLGYNNIFEKIEDSNQGALNTTTMSQMSHASRYHSSLEKSGAPQPELTAKQIMSIQYTNKLPQATGSPAQKLSVQVFNQKMSSRNEKQMSQQQALAVRPKESRTNLAGPCLNYYSKLTDQDLAKFKASKGNHAGESTRSKQQQLGEQV